MKRLAIAIGLILALAGYAHADGYTWDSGYKGDVPPASAIEVDTTLFDNNLSVTDEDVQTALETIDDLTLHDAVTVTDTTTIDLTLTGQDIKADGLYTAGDALTLTGADFDFDGGATPGGDLSNTWADPQVDDDSHNHTSTTISGLDISDDTNLAVTSPVVLTDDTLSLNQDAGTDVTADLEEETHASEHAVGGADTVFPADPNADKFLKWNDTGGAIEWADDNNTQLTEEQVEDFVGGMLGGTETLISVDYQDATNDIDFVVNDDLSLYDNATSGFITTTLTQEEVEDYAGALMANATGTHTGISVTYQDATGDMDLVVDHDAASNFVAAEHVDWAAASAGTIHTDNYIENATHTGEVTGSGALTIADSVTVTGWVMGASTATTPAADDNDTSLATTAWCETTQDYLKTSELSGAETDPIYSANSYAVGMDQDVDTTATPTFAGLASTGDIDVDAANGNITLQHPGGDEFGWHTEAGSIMYLKNNTDRKGYLLADADHRLYLGTQDGVTGDILSLIVRTDGTGDTEVQLPSDSIGNTELDESQSYSMAGLTMSGNIAMADDTWIGIGSPNNARLEFDATPSPDTIDVCDAELRISGNTSFYIGGADGTAEIGRLYNSAGDLTFEGDGNRDVAFGSENHPKVLFVNGLYEMVGINDTSPDKALEVIDDSGTQLRLTHTDTVDHCDFGVDGDGYLGIMPSGGRVGIGTTSPGGKLHLASSNADLEAIFDTYDNGVKEGTFRIRKSDTDTIGTAASTDDTDGLGQVVWQGVDAATNFDYGARIRAVQNGAASTYVPTDLFLYTYSDASINTNQLVLHHDGGVGVGTATPATALEVNGAITFRELSADPANPDEGSAVIWMSDGTGSGSDGDILLKRTAGGVTKTYAIVMSEI